MSEINPIEFGKLLAQVKRLEGDVSELRGDVKSLISMLEQARGGWRTLMIVGGTAGAAGAILGKIAGWWLTNGAKV